MVQQPPMMTLARFVVHVYWPRVSVDYSPNWRRDGLRHCAAIVAGLGWYAPLFPELQADHCAAWWAQARGQWGARTANMLLKRVRSICRKGIGWGHHPGPDPTVDLRPLPENPERVKYLTDTWRGRLIEGANPRLALYIQVARLTAARRGELWGLRERCIDFERRTVTFEGRRKGGYRSTLVLPLTTALEDVLRPCLTGEPEHHVLYPYKSKGSITQGFRRLRQRVGLPDGDFRFHDLRHDAAVSLLKRNGNLKLVQQALGHRSITTTARYAHVVDDELRAAMERL